jgi:hypothetical protein
MSSGFTFPSVPVLRSAIHSALCHSTACIIVNSIIGTPDNPPSETLSSYVAWPTALKPIRPLVAYCPSCFLFPASKPILLAGASGFVSVTLVTQLPVTCSGSQCLRPRLHPSQLCMRLSSCRPVLCARRLGEIEMSEAVSCPRNTAKR